MSQARVCLDGLEKVQRQAKSNSRVETGVYDRRISWRGRGGPPDFSPPSATSPRSPMRRGRLAMRGGSLRPGDTVGGQRMQRRRIRRLFLAGGIGLPRREMRPRRRVRLPDRQRHPRGLCRTAEAHEPSEEIGAMLLKHWQDGFGGEGSLCLHTAIDSARVLKDCSDEAATTPKIVTDAVVAQGGPRPKNAEVACIRAGTLARAASRLAEQFAGFLVDEMQPGAGEADHRLIGIRLVRGRDFWQPVLHGGAQPRAFVKDMPAHRSIMRGRRPRSPPYSSLVGGRHLIARCSGSGRSGRTPIPHTSRSTPRTAMLRGSPKARSASGTASIHATSSLPPGSAGRHDRSLRRRRPHRYPHRRCPQRSSGR